MKIKPQTIPPSPNRPYVKICGITRVQDATACVTAGADAVGCVFYPKSPRHVNPEQARTICDALPAGVQSVGVFVNETGPAIMNTVKKCGLGAVQLHGQESEQLVRYLKDRGLVVIKTLFIYGRPGLADALRYDADCFLVESGTGALPGGNARQWGWSAAEPFGRTRSFILAGGLSPANITRAVSDARPAGVDLSSGVESAPGLKDPKKIRALMEAVATIEGCTQLHNPFHRRIV